MGHGSGAVGQDSGIWVKGRESWSAAVLGNRPNFSDSDSDSGLEKSTPTPTPTPTPIKTTDSGRSDCDSDSDSAALVRAAVSRSGE